MKYASVCSGIEAASVAWIPLGWTCSWLAEIDPVCCAVLKHRYPETPNLGDMEHIHEKEEFKRGSVDVLIGGPPCQSFSVAGLRKGMDDPRGNLSLVYLRVVDKLRPRWLVYENVPGLLSSWSDAKESFTPDHIEGDNDGNAYGRATESGWQTNNFDTFTSGLSELGYGWSWAIYDAQFFGVAQRRRRIFLVGHISGESKYPFAVLSQFTSLQGNSAPSRTQGQKVTGTLEARTRSGGGLGDIEFDGGLIANTITTREGHHGEPSMETLIPLMSPALKARDYKGPFSDGTGDGAPLIPCIVPTLTGNAAGDRPSDYAPMVFQNEGEQQATAHKGNAAKALRLLRDQVGEETFSKWGLGILISLYPSEVLRSKMYGFNVRQPTEPKHGLVNYTLSRTEIGSGWPMRGMWEAGCDGCPPQGWKPSEQLALELGTYLSELPQSPSSAERFMQDLWDSAEGTRVLRQTLGTFQKIWRSITDQGQSVYSDKKGDGVESSQDMQGDRVLGEIPCERVLRETCDIGVERKIGKGSFDKKRSFKECLGNQTFKVRRLVVEETEALQGFPRGYTLVPYRGKFASDSVRYKGIGNSFAVPVVAWIGKRIQMVEDIMNELK